MKVEQLFRVDLSLLICLKVLLEEQNVSRTASRLNLSQSAISKNLAKLRNQLGDPLFTRSAYGLVPTAKALELGPLIQTWLDQAQKILTSDQFQPALSDREFRIATVESAYPLVFSKWLPQVYSEAPDVRVNTHLWTENAFRELRAGNLDLGITGKDIRYEDAKITMPCPEDIRQHVLYFDTQCCAVNKTLPLAAGELTFEKYISSRHIQARCNNKDRWLLDHLLAQKGYQRDIAMVVPDFTSAVDILLATNFIFTGPYYYLSLLAENYSIELHPLPFDCPPYASTLFWHKSKEEDPANRWLRSRIVSSTDKFRKQSVDRLNPEQKPSSFDENF